MATEGATGLSTTAIETCIVGWADETQDGDEIPAARAELAALVEAAGRAAALARACAAKDEALRALLPYFGALGLRMVRAGEFAAHAESLGQVAARVDAALAAGADAGPGAAGARDEAAVEALRQVVDCACGGLGELCLVCQEAIGDALRAGGAGEGG